MRDDEQSLIQMALEGDSRAFEQLISPYTRQIFATLYSMLSDVEDAQEVYQEVLLKAWNNLASKRSDGSFKSWIMTIAVNSAINFRSARTRRREGEQTAQQADPIGMFMANSSSAPERDTAYKDLIQAVNAAIEKLSEKHRTVLIMHVVDGMSYEEIAKTLGIELGTVMSRLHYARRKIKLLLKDKIEERGLK